MNDDTISLTILKKSLKENRVCLVDIRELSERENGYVPDAVHFPFSEITEDMVDDRLPNDVDLYLHCQSGRRALVAKELLRKNYPRVHALPYNFEEILNG
jgi:phage shock protein E